MLLMILSVSLFYITKDSKITNEEHPEINRIKGSINVTNEEHPEINSVKTPLFFK